jgi:hypothetical protein
MAETLRVYAILKQEQDLNPRAFNGFRVKE